MQKVSFIEGGVTAPIGFIANGIRAGIKSSRKTNDTALIFSEKICSAAGMFTQNRVKAESVKRTQANISDGRAQAIIANAGNANACTGKQGAENAYRMACTAAEALEIDPDDVVVCSTGVIGQQLPVEKIEEVLPELKKGLSKEHHTEARIAVMTTDTHYKECAAVFEIDGKRITIGTMAKGSGMIHINLGTMLGFITTDCAISSEMLEKALHMSVAGTYNCVSVDGDTSTNDTLVVLANGMAGNTEITQKGPEFSRFVEALTAVNTVMAKKIAADGEGADRLIECRVTGASTVSCARVLAKSVISSNLVKAAFFGKDANWGRILCAMGYSGADFTPEKTTVSFLSYPESRRYFDEMIANEDFSKDALTLQKIKVFENGVPLDFDEERAKQILSEESVHILVELQDGKAEGTAWGCDLTYDYVQINGDYRT